MRGRIIHGRRTPTRPWLLGGSAVLASACAHGDPRRGCADHYSDDAVVAVVAVLEDQQAAWNAGDIEGFLAGYERSSALLFTSGGSVRRGFDETREKYRARYGEASETMGTLAFEILDVRPLGACSDAAVVLGRWALSETPAAGSGVFSLVLVHDPSGWRIVHDHTSSDP